MQELIDCIRSLASRDLHRGLAALYSMRKRRFVADEQHDYGGNILSILFPNLRQPREGGPPQEEFDRHVSWLIEWSTVVVATPTAAPELRYTAGSTR